MTGRSGSQGTESGSGPGAEPPAAAAESVPGYRELTRIGHGGFSVVYRAVQESFGRDVALKVLTVVGPDEDARRRFRREVRLAGKLSGHPHVVTVLDAGTTGSGRPYLAMDLYEGGSMKERLGRSGPLSAAETAVVGAKIAEALAAAHARRAAPRREAEQHPRLPVRRAGAGRLRRLLPAGLELLGLRARRLLPAARRARADDARRAERSSDIYALGSTLYELLTGHSPFGGPGRDVRAIMWRTLSEPAPRPDCPELPELADAIVRALAKEPEERFPDAADFAKALRALIPEGAAPTLAMPEVSRTVVMVDALDGAGVADLADLDSGSASISGSISRSTGGSVAADHSAESQPRPEPALEPIPVSDATSTGRSRRVDETMVRPDRMDPDAVAPKEGQGNGLRRARKPLVLLVSLGLLGAIGWLVYDSQGSSTASSNDDASAHHAPIAASADASPSRSAARSTHSATPTPSSTETTSAASETKAAASTAASASASAASASASATSTSGSILSGLSTYYRFYNAQSGDCLTSPATQSACASSASEGWAYSEPLTGLLSAVTGEYELVNKQSGDCLTAGSGGQVSAETCDSDRAAVDDGPGNRLRIAQRPVTRLCLQTSGGGVVDGTCSTSDTADLWSQTEP
jgi:serine/threonine protein kinase